MGKGDRRRERVCVCLTEEDIRESYALPLSKLHPFLAPSVLLLLLFEIIKDSRILLLSRSDQNCGKQCAWRWCDVFVLAQCMYLYVWC